VKRKVVQFFCLICFLHVSMLEAKEIYIYRGQGVDNNLKEMPEDIITADLPYEKTYLMAVGGFFPLTKVFDTIDIGTTGVIVKHHGMQSHVEVDCAMSMRYKELLPHNDVINANYAMGIGLSYAFATPVYEDTASNGKYYRFQAFLHFDVEIYTPYFSHVSFLARVHHRSGIYGLIAPRNVGSNFVAFGLAYHF